MTKRALRLHLIYNTNNIYFIILLSSNHHVLDVGSGLGGPARYLAHKTGCLVTAIELQDDLHKEAENLTQRCNLQQKLRHITGDFLQMDLGGYSYQARVFLLISRHALEYPTQLTSLSLLVFPWDLYVDDLSVSDWLCVSGTAWSLAIQQEEMA